MNRSYQSKSNSTSSSYIYKELGENSKPKKEEKQTLLLLKDLLRLTVRLLAITIFAFLIFTFVYGIYYNIDQSMNPAVKSGDLVIYSCFDRKYKAKDLLVLNYQGEKQIRRVIAIAGDVVDITEEGLYINGALQQEREINHTTERFQIGIDFPVTLKDDEYFLLGDIREGIMDSRIYGPVNTKDTLGKVITIIRRRNL